MVSFWLFWDLVSGVRKFAVSCLVCSALDVPIYHPCANTIRRPKAMKTVAVAIQRYVVYGVDLSR